MRAMTINPWLYYNKTWLNALKVKTGAHAGPLHQGPWKASYAPACYDHLAMIYARLLG